ncbi:MAG: protein-L-isoaspartate(D-aspartate) O-methyltransferase [Planctomycetes bacterium]|nr:protein-L-isoaspartate(D-aspartate) O-methyltransferase [Planctomycetota bacterium]
MHESERRQMLATIEDLFRRTAARTGFGSAGSGVLEAMGRVPREQFVPPESAHRAYDDTALALACGQTISQPFVVALMTTLLRPRRDHRVLEIGTGSGYQAAVLSHLVREVWSLEVVPELAHAAATRLQRLGHRNVHVQAGDGTHGWPEHAPYDGIVVTCGGEAVPPALLEQLAPHGHLVMPVGPADDQRLLDVTRDRRGAVRLRDVLGVRFVPFVHLPAPAPQGAGDDARSIGLAAAADSAAAAFADLALAVSSLVVPARQVRPERRIEFACSATSPQQLLARWLDEVAWAMRRQELVFATFEVAVRGDSLRATGWGQPIEATGTTPRTDPRTWSLQDPRLERTATGYRASCRVATDRQPV